MTALRTVELFVPDIGDSLNAVLFTQKSWAIYRGLKNRIGKAVMASGAPRTPTFARPVTLEFCPRLGPRRRKFDCTNFIVAAKIIEDWLVHYDVLRSDTSEYVKRIIIDEPLRAADGVEGMLVRITEVEGEPLLDQTTLPLAEPAPF